MPAGTGEVVPYRVVPVIDLDPHAHGRHGSRGIAFIQIPTGGIDDTRSAADGVGSAVEERHDGADADGAEVLVSERQSMEIDPVPVLTVYTLFVVTLLI